MPLNWVRILEFLNTTGKVFLCQYNKILFFKHIRVSSMGTLSHFELLSDRGWRLIHQKGARKIN